MSYGLLRDEPTTWTADKIAMMRSMFEKGHSAAEIADALGGTTGGAIFGKIWRLRRQDNGAKPHYVGPRTTFPMTQTILRVLPDFCWQSAQQVLTMLAQIDEDISCESVKVTLCHLARAGQIEFRDGGINMGAFARGGGIRPNMRVRMYKAVARSLSAGS